MAVYSYYYGASPEQGIGVRAQSPELAKLPLTSEMQELASLHALESSEHSGEMMAYLLEKEGYSILGVSYTEAPKASGYSRSAPCSLQYIAPAAELENASVEMSRIVNFVSFKKPGTTAPAPMRYWPLNESGYYYHNSPDVLAPLLDGAIRAGLSKGKEVLLVALPKKKNSEYAFARYTMAELLACIPVSMRAGIRFFTGLPVTEGTSDPAVGFDNAVRFGANVVFCPNEYFSRITSYRSCIGVNMEAPGRSAGAFASYIAQAPDVSDALSAVESCLSGPLTYDALNTAAQQAAGGKVPTVSYLMQELEKSKRYSQKLEQQIDAGNQEYSRLRDEKAQQDRMVQRLQGEIQQLKSEPVPYAPRDYGYSSPAPVQRNSFRDEEEKKSGAGRKVLAGLAALVLLAGGAAGGFFFAKGRYDKEPVKQEEKADIPSAAEEDPKGGEPEKPTPAPVPTPAPATEETDQVTEPTTAASPEAVGEATAETPAPAETEGETPSEPEAGEKPAADPDGQQDPETEESPDENTEEDPDENTEEPGEEAELSEQENEEPTEEERLRQQFPNLAKDTRVLKNHDKGDAVKELQQRLLDLGYDIGADTPDGKFGSKTENAVKTFQHNNQLDISEKQLGQVDEITKSRLFSPDAVRGDEDN